MAVASSSAPPWRQIAALGYDLLPVIAIWWLAAALVTLVLGRSAEPGTASGIAVIITGSVMHCSYYSLSWRLSGQTIGMRAWRIRMSRLDGEPVGWRLALARSVIAVPLLVWGWCWVVLDPDRCSLQDRLCRTRIRAC